MKARAYEFAAMVDRDIEALTDTAYRLRKGKGQSVAGGTSPFEQVGTVS